MPVAEPEADTPVARARVTPFVTGTDYGTRAATLILADDSGGWRCIERRFGPGRRARRRIPGPPLPVGAALAATGLHPKKTGAPLAPPLVCVGSELAV